MYRFLDEAVRRTKMHLKFVEKAFWFEYGDLLRNDRQFIDKIEKRKEASIVLDGTDYIYADRKIVVDRVSIDRNVRKIEGTAASKGKYRGIAKIVLNQKDFRKIKEGDILVTEMTRPDFLPILKKAGAIVTDEGGLTCHAAIVARELGIPCIVGTRIGTRVLHDGNLIEVNADKGIITILKMRSR